MVFHGSSRDANAAVHVPHRRHLMRGERHGSRGRGASTSTSCRSVRAASHLRVPQGADAGDPTHASPIARIEPCAAEKSAGAPRPSSADLEALRPARLAFHDPSTFTLTASYWRAPLLVTLTHRDRKWSRTRGFVTSYEATGARRWIGAARDKTLARWPGVRVSSCQRATDDDHNGL